MARCMSADVGTVAVLTVIILLSMFATRGFILSCMHAQRQKLREDGVYSRRWGRGNESGTTALLLPIHA